MVRKPGRMANLGNKSVERTNVELSDEEANILLTTKIDWEELRPKVSNQEVYDKLIAAVEEATQKNENLAQLKTRFETLGKEGFAMVKTIVDLIP